MTGVESNIVNAVPNVFGRPNPGFTAPAGSTGAVQLAHDPRHDAAEHLGCETPGLRIITAAMITIVKGQTAPQHLTLTMCEGVCSNAQAECYQDRAVGDGTQRKNHRASG
jgi:hypothetical protein